jgi:hypothetical protein
MFIRRLKIKGGVPLFSHRFRFMFEAYLIKGSSIFLKIDEPPKKMVKNGSTMVLGKIYELYKSKKESILKVLVGELMKKKDFETLDDGVKLIGKPIDQSTLELLDREVSMNGVVNELSVDRKSRGIITNPENKLLYNPISQFSITTNSIELGELSKTKGIIKESNLELNNPNPELDKLFVDKHIMSNRKAKLTDIMKESNLELREVLLDEIVKRDYQELGKLGATVVENNSNNYELSGFDRGMLNIKFEETIRRATKPKEILISHNQFVGSTLNLEVVNKVDLKRSVTKEKIIGITEAAVKITLEKNQLTPVELSKIKVNVEVNKEVIDSRRVGQNAFRIFFRSDFPRSSEINGSARNVKRKVSIPMYVNEQAQSFINKIQPIRGISINNILDRKFIVNASGIVEGRPTTKSSSPIFTDRISIFQFTTDDNIITSLYNVTLRDSIFKERNKFFSALSRRDIFKPDDALQLIPDKRENATIIEMMNYLDKLNRDDIFINNGGSISLISDNITGLYKETYRGMSRNNLRGIMIENGDRLVKSANLRGITPADIIIGLKINQMSGIHKQEFIKGLVGYKYDMGTVDYSRWIRVKQPKSSTKSESILVDKAVLKDIDKPNMQKLVMDYEPLPIVSHINNPLKRMHYTKVTKNDTFSLDDLTNPNIEIQRVKAHLKEINTPKLTKYKNQNQRDFLTLIKRWWFITPSNPKTRINLPMIDYPYETQPVLGINKHPIPHFTNEGMKDIDVSIEVVLELVNIVMHWWHHSYNELFSGLGDETILGLFNVLEQWYYLASSQEEINEKSSDSDYKRVFRWMRWEAEKVFFDFKQDSANNLIYNGNHYMETFTKNLLDYVEFHHYMVVPLYKSLDKMDIMRSIMGDNPQGDIMTELPDKNMGERGYIIDSEDDDGHLL